MDLKSYVEVLQRRWRVALLVAAVVLVVFALASLIMPRDYQAEVLLRIGTPLGGSSSDTNYETTFATHLMNTYAEIAISNEVQSQLKEMLGVKKLPSITVQNIPNSEILQVVAEGSNPGLVVKAANGLADILASYQDDSDEVPDSAALNMLDNRKVQLEGELTKYQQQHDDLIKTYSQTAAQMAVLNGTLNTKSGTYQNLEYQYEQAVVTDTVSPTTGSRAMRDALAKEMSGLQKEIDGLNQQYQDLSQSSNLYLQQITLMRQTIQNTQSTYSDLLTRYDNVSLANLRQKNAQKAVIVSRAAEPPYAAGPGRGFIVGLGLILGLILGLLAAFVVDNLGLRVRLGTREL